MENTDSKTFPTLSTERLTLRQLSESDVLEIFQLRSDAEINRYLGRQPSKSPEDALAFIKNIKSNSLSYWAIALRENEKLVGTICLYDISEEDKKCEFGYELLTEYQGQGIMREAAKKIIEYAVQTLGMETIDAYTHMDNQRSSKLLEVLNFEHVPAIDEAVSKLFLYRYLFKTS